MLKFWEKEKLKNISKGKVFVGVSGGVDSSVSAALLKKQGYDVTGVFIKVWYPPFLECNWQDEKRDAMRVCASLGIPFLMFDFENEYKKEVVDYMVNEYKKGRTPNPDVSCNRSIKFGSFFKKAREMGADLVATGHYASVLSNSDQTYGLYESTDKEKDQTYFLWTIKKDDIKNIIFPIGHLKKREVRKKAEMFNLPTFAKKDSQGLCFLGKLDMKEFLKNFIESQEGDVLDESGKVIGKHDGAFFYTIGQRHGFNIESRSSNQKPLYVVSKNMERNTLIVSQNLSQESSGTKGVIIKNTNWMREPAFNEVLHSRTRYRQRKVESNVRVLNSNESEVLFKEVSEILSPGQSLVVYSGEECLGGGIIEDVF